MELLTLIAARAAVWDAASNVPYNENDIENVLKVNTTINRACELFFRGGGNWRGMTERIAISAYGGIVTLPRCLQTILGVKSEHGAAMLVHPVWFEFLGGSCSLNGLHGMNDLGEGYRTFRDIPSPSQLVVTSTEANDSDAVLELGGIDNAGVPFTQNIELKNASTLVATPTWRITKLHKPATTGYVRIFYINDLLLIPIGIMEPGEADANYRRYRVSTLNDYVDCICKRAYIPAVADNDLVVPGYAEAIRTMIQALIYKDRNDRERFVEYRDDAIAMADADRQQFDGDNQTPMYQVVPGFGVQSINRLPRGIWNFGNYVPGHYDSAASQVTDSEPVALTPMQLLALLQAASGSLPTTDPHSAGAWWNNGSEVVISNG